VSPRSIRSLGAAFGWHRLTLSTGGSTSSDAVADTGETGAGLQRAILGALDNLLDDRAAVFLNKRADLRGEPVRPPFWIAARIARCALLKRHGGCFFVAKSKREPRPGGCTGVKARSRTATGGLTTEANAIVAPIHLKAVPITDIARRSRPVGDG
jgi:hypothetical protein